jgi:HSP20 family molecular chaperone IbpA
VREQHSPDLETKKASSQILAAAARSRRLYRFTWGGRSMTFARSAAPQRRFADLVLPLPPVDSPIIELPGGSYPPYNIERLDHDLYRIVVGVAGYAASEIEVREDGLDLVVRGATSALESNGQTIRRLIEPSFERRFRLVGGFRLDEWDMRNGLLVIYVAREPGVPVGVDRPPQRVDAAAAELAA